MTTTQIHDVAAKESEFFNLNPTDEQWVKTDRGYEFDTDPTDPFAPSIVVRARYVAADPDDLAKEASYYIEKSLLPKQSENPIGKDARWSVKSLEVRSLGFHGDGHPMTKVSQDKLDHLIENLSITPGDLMLEFSMPAISDDEQKRRCATLNAELKRRLRGATLSEACELVMPFDDFCDLNRYAQDVYQELFAQG